MNLPLQAAIISLLANLTFSILFIGEYQVHGLAWANVLAAVMQTAYLAFRLEEIPIHTFSLISPSKFHPFCYQLDLCRAFYGF